MSALVVPGINNIGPYPAHVPAQPVDREPDLSYLRTSRQRRREAVLAASPGGVQRAQPSASSGYNLTSNVTNGRARPKQHLQQLHRPGGFEQYSAGREHLGSRTYFGSTAARRTCASSRLREVLLLTAFVSNLWAVRRFFRSASRPRVIFGHQYRERPAGHARPLHRPL